MTDIQDTTTGTAHPLRDRVFIATAVTVYGRPRPLVEGTSIRLTFRENGDLGWELGVTGGCNAMSFPLEVEPTRLHTGRGIITEIACDADRMAQDDWVWTFFTDDPAWELCPPGLVLTGGDVRMELVEALPPPLWGTTFDSIRVSETGIVPAPVVDGTTITLAFTAPDSLSAQAGCNTLGFQVSDAGDHLEVGDDVASTRMACTPELMAQDEWLITLLTADPSYTLTSGALTLVRGATTVVLAPRLDG